MPAEGYCDTTASPSSTCNAADLPLTESPPGGSLATVSMTWTGNNPQRREGQGLAHPTTNVTVNGNVASRQGEYFHHALNVPNATAQYPTITVTSPYGAGQSRAGEVFVPASPETSTHDADGNLTQDGRWTYVWDGENRLVELKPETSPPVGAKLRWAFDHDHQSRRICKQRSFPQVPAPPTPAPAP